MDTSLVQLCTIFFPIKLWVNLRRDRRMAEGVHVHVFALAHTPREPLGN